MILDTNGLLFGGIDNMVVSLREVNMSVGVGSYPEVDFRGYLVPGMEHKLVASRCHLCFAPLVKEGSERERDLKTGVWVERATGEYACGTTVTFEPDKKMAVTPGAKVRIGPRCVKLLKKK